MIWRTLLLGNVIAFGMASIVTMTFFWWMAAFSTPRWVVTVVFNGIGEHWIEGILLHWGIFVMVAAIWYLRPKGG